MADWANEEQNDYMRYLGTLEPSEKCWCGWYRLGDCLNCPPDKSAQDKLDSKKGK